MPVRFPPLDTKVTSTQVTIRIANIVLNSFTNDSRVLKISQSLANSDFDVTVLALHEPSLAVTEKIAGFRVHRLRLLSRNLPRRKFFQLFKFLEFMLQVIIRYRGFGIYHCNDLHTLPLGVILKSLSFGRSKIIYDAHEYESEANGLGKMEKKFRRILEYLLIRFADRVVTVSNGIADEYARIYRIEKPVLIYNLPRWSNVGRHDYFRKQFAIGEDETIFLYQGGLSRGRGIEVLLDAFKACSNTGRVIVLMGYGPLQKEIQDRARVTPNIYFHEAVSSDLLPMYTSSADVGIATIENTCLSYYYCLPNKLFEYLMAEIPVIVSNLYEMRQLVRDHELGVIAADNTVDGIGQALLEMDDFDRESFYARIGEFKRKFNWEVQEQDLLRLYQEL